MMTKSLNCQEVGQSVYIIWSMGYQWDYKKKRPKKFEKGNPYGDYATLEEAQLVLSKLTAWDDWSGTKEAHPDYKAVYWIFRETCMASREVFIRDNKQSDMITETRDGYTYPKSKTLEIEG
jgi:hypothetical protein